MRYPVACLGRMPRTLAILGIALFTTGSLATDIEWRHRAVQDRVSLMANSLGVASRISFYEGRGFTSSAIEPYAQACGFSFGMLNEGDKTIVTQLKSWRAMGADGEEISLRPPEEWEADWRDANIPEPARIAFRWAQFQSEITFEPGDWIMGMATLASAPKPPFRILARYRDNQEDHELQLDQLHCADD